MRLVLDLVRLCRFDGTSPIQPLRYMYENMTVVPDCQGLWGGDTYRDLGNEQVTFSVTPSQGCSSSQLEPGMRFAKVSARDWPLIIQEYSSMNWCAVFAGLRSLSVWSGLHFPVSCGSSMELQSSSTRLGLSTISHDASQARSWLGSGSHHL